MKMKTNAYLKYVGYIITLCEVFFNNMLLGKPQAIYRNRYGYFSCFLGRSDILSDILPKIEQHLPLLRPFDQLIKIIV